MSQSTSEPFQDFHYCANKSQQFYLISMWHSGGVRVKWTGSAVFTLERRKAVLCLKRNGLKQV